MALVSINDEPTGRSLVVAAPERRHVAMRRARRHTLLVRALRLLLPVASVGLLASYVVFMQRTVEISNDTHVGKLNTGTLSLSAAEPTMHNPSYVGFNRKDGSEYVIRAKRAVTDLSQKKPINLFGIGGELKQRDGVITKLAASEGQYFRKAERLSLSKEINVQSSNGMSAQLSVADISLAEGTIKSSKPVLVSFPAGTLRGNTMLLRQKQREITFSNGVAARLKPEKSNKAQQPTQTGQAQSGLVAFAGQSDEPVDVHSQSLLIKDDQKSARFSGSVRAAQGEARLQAKMLDIYYTGTAAQGGTASQPSSGVDRIIAHGNVIITRNEDRVVSRRADFNVRSNTAVLDGGVVMTSGDDRRVMADKAEIDTTSDRVLLTGRVIVSQADNTLRGSRLFYDQRSGKMKLSQSAGARPGRITARFANGSKGGMAAKAKKAAHAASGNVLAGPDFRTDPGAPIDVEAAVLDIDDKARVATFRGDVVARRGGFEVKTSVLRAVYTGEAGLALQSRGQAGLPNGGQRQAAQLKSIVAPGRVTVSSGDGRTAVGESGSFDIASNKATLAGKVVLKQGRQIIRGAKLVIDLKSGFSRMLTADGWSSVASNGQEGIRRAPLKRGAVPNAADVRKCGPGRMCAVFYPSELKGQGDKGGKLNGRARSTTAAGANANSGKAGRGGAPVLGSSWSASTTAGSNASPSN